MSDCGCSGVILCDAHMALARAVIGTAPWGTQVYSTTTFDVPPDLPPITPGDRRACARCNDPIPDGDVVSTYHDNVERFYCSRECADLVRYAREFDAAQARIRELEAAIEAASSALAAADIPAEGLTSAASLGEQVDLAAHELNRLRKEAPEAWALAKEHIRKSFGKRRFRLELVHRREDMPGRPYEFEAENGKPVYVVPFKAAAHEWISREEERRVRREQGIPDNVALVFIDPQAEFGPVFELVPAEPLDTIR